MINKELLKAIIAILKQWITGERNYSFEARLFRPLSKFQYPQGGFVVIIDVQGFYKNEEYSDPIKLHYEVIISAPELHNQTLTQEQIYNYISSFPEKLNSVTLNAYKEFENKLNGYKANGNIYSYDSII